MESEKNVAKEIGNRCKRARNALGWSQQTLAEKIGMSTQNISKLEKNGISNINDIIKLSEILGVDLQNDERDVEGSFGEVGKEILGALIKNHGYLDFENLVHLYMLGMNGDDVSKEIRKLSALWFCVREVYTDFDGDECDGVFITAKGIMAYKNTVSPVHLEEVADALGETVSYEKRIGQSQSYQDWIDSRPWEKKIHELKVTSAYRAGYIRFLYDTFTTPKLQWAVYDKKVADKNLGAKQLEFINDSDVLRNQNVKDTFPGVSFHFDVCHQMALEIDKDQMNDVMNKAVKESQRAKCEFPQTIEEKYWYPHDLLTAYDPLGKDALAAIDEFPTLGKLDDIVKKTYDELEEAVMVDNSPDATGTHDIKLSDTLGGTEKELAEELEQILTEWKSGTADKHDILNRLGLYSTKMATFPDGWFWKEIPAYVQANYPPAVTKEESELDNLLLEINQLYAPTVLYYYGSHEYPELEEMMKTVRTQYGIKDPVFSETEIEGVHEIKRENMNLFYARVKD